MLVKPKCKQPDEGERQKQQLYICQEGRNSERSKVGHLRIHEAGNVSGGLAGLQAMSWRMGRLGSIMAKQPHPEGRMP